MRFLHLSDLHLGWNPRFLGNRAAERARERNDVLRQATDIALDSKYSIDLVVIAGDLFDSHRPEAAVVEYALRELQRLTQAGKSLITVPGNHDEITYHDSVYRQYESRWPGLLVREANPAYINTIAVGGANVHVYSVAYTAGLTRCEVPLADLPIRAESGIHLGIFHGSLDWNTGERSLPLSSRELARVNYDYVALGHYHRTSTHTVGRGVASYCGAPAARGFDDLGTGGVQCVTINDAGVRFDAIPLSLRPQYILEIKLDEVESEVELFSRVAELGNPRAIVRVALTGIAPFAVDEEVLTGRCADYFHYVEVCDFSESFSPSLVELLSREPSIRGAFVRRMLNKIENSANEDKDVCLKALHRGLRAFRGV